MSAEKVRHITGQEVVKVNPLLEKERSKCTFHLPSLTKILFGGEEALKRYRKIVDLVVSDPELVGQDIRQMGRDAIFEEYLKRHVNLLQKIKKLKIDDAKDQLTFRRVVLITGLTGISLHLLMFVPMLQLASSEEQLKKWMPLVESFRMIGCYAQTEIGHGTFLKGLETTAIYDPSTGLITLNSPTLTSIKFWVGGLGKTATHCVLMAQLYSKGKYCGLQAFLLPLRDQNHFPLPGIIVGDIGPKMGLPGVDNGYMRLDNVTIPRKNMLMRYSQLHPDGSFTTAPCTKLIQGSMLFARVILSKDAAFVSAMSTTIAIRYSCVRIQSSLSPNKPEVQILEHKTQQHKLMPLLSQSYAFVLAMPPIEAFIMDALEESKTNQSSNQPKLFEAHSLSSCLKVFTTMESSAAVEQCRLACGGHGFLNGSHLPIFYKDLAATVTAEGEITVLLLQAARYLMKSYDDYMNNRIPPASCFSSYLWCRDFSKQQVQVDDLHTLTVALQYRARSLLEKCYKRFQSMVQSCDISTAWNHCSIQLCAISMAHVDSVIATTFFQEVEKHNPSSSSSFPPSAPSSGKSRLSSTPLSTYRVLRDVCNLYLVHRTLHVSGDLLQLGYITAEVVDELVGHREHLYNVLRPDAVSLVDAFEFHDRQLSSVLGCYDGNVYERLFEWAQASELNRNQVHPAIIKYLMPMREKLFAKL